MNAPQLRAIARAAVILATLALSGCTAGSSTNKEAVAPDTHTASCCAGAASPQTLVVTGPDGHLMRLVYSPGNGWKYLALANQEGDDAWRNLSFQPIGLSPLPAAHARSDATSASNAVTDSHPLAVFIDGPTGYTFAWTAEDGWRFVGRIKDQRP